MANVLSSLDLANTALFNASVLGRMPRMANNFAKALRAQMKIQKFTNEALAEKVGSHPITISKLLNGRMELSEKWMRKFAVAFGVTIQDMLAESDGFMEEPPAYNIPPLRRDRQLPVYGLAAGAITGAHTRTNEPVEYVACPPGLATVRDAYALIVVGHSMEPRYFTGEVVYINPHRPVRAGDHVVVQEQRDGGIQVSIKLFDKITDTKVITRQYNPPSQIEFLKSRVLHVHRVMNTNELMVM